MHTLSKYTALHAIKNIHLSPGIYHVEKEQHKATEFITVIYFFIPEKVANFHLHLRINSRNILRCIQ